MPTMPSEAPLVCAIMPVNGRAAMVRRAVASFRAQTYANKCLMLLDTGVPSYRAPLGPFEAYCFIGGFNGTIGELRNEAIRNGPDAADIICHFDSDDHSHPQRIAEQVALLQASGADCVGYREALFWDTRGCNSHGLQVKGGRVVEGAAWLYSDPLTTHCLGASMCYWRKTWERRPFDHISHGEDYRFASRCKTHGVTSVTPHGKSICGQNEPIEPRIICGIHGDRQSGGYDLKGNVWRRAPHFDEYCLKAMAL